jgi:hypothetical protein
MRRMRAKPTRVASTATTRIPIEATLVPPGRGVKRRKARLVP